MKADLTWLWPGKLAVSLQHNLQIQHGGIRFAPVRIRLAHLRKVSLKQSEAECLLRRWCWRWHVGRAILVKQNCRRSWTRFKRNYMHLNGNLQGLYTRLRRCLWSLCNNGPTSKAYNCSKAPFTVLQMTDTKFYWWNHLMWKQKQNPRYATFVTTSNLRKRKIWLSFAKESFYWHAWRESNKGFLGMPHLWQQVKIEKGKLEWALLKKAFIDMHGNQPIFETL